MLTLLYYFNKKVFNNCVIEIFRDYYNCKHKILKFQLNNTKSIRYFILKIQQFWALVNLSYSLWEINLIK